MLFTFGKTGNRNKTVDGASPAPESRDDATLETTSVDAVETKENNATENSRSMHRLEKTLYPFEPIAPYWVYYTYYLKLFARNEMAARCLANPYHLPKRAKCLVASLRSEAMS